MKKISLIFCILISPLIMGQGNIGSRVGDFVTMQGMVSGANFITTYAYSGLTATGMKLSQETYLNGNHLGSSVEEIAADDVMTPEKAGLLVALCPQIGGVVEEIDLPVGRTATCRVDAAALVEASYDQKFLEFNLEGMANLMDEMNAMQVWLGPFPVLGFAQMTINTDVIQVVNYRWN